MTSDSEWDVCTWSGKRGLQKAVESWILQDIFKICSSYDEVSDYFAQVNQLLAQALAAQTQQAQLAQLGMVSSQPGVTLQNIASQPISIAPAVNTGKTISYQVLCVKNYSQFRHT